MLGIFREKRYSPNRVEDDANILKLTAEAVRRRGHHVDLLKPSELNSKTSPQTTFAMCRGPSSLNLLDRWQKIGCTVINSPAAVRNCYRYRTISLLAETPIPIPKTLVIQTSEKLNGQCDLAKGLWVKRGDVHKTHPENVQLIYDRPALEDAFASLRSRWVRKAVLQEHVPGDLIKFYGVLPLGWFKFFYHDGQETNGHPICPEQLRKTGEMAASRLGLQVYGGDIVVDANGYYLIEINNWPSFAMCSEEAAEQIATYLILADQRWNSHEALKWRSA